MLRLVPIVLLAGAAAAAKDAPPPPPAASMSLAIDAPASGPWHLVATNTGDEVLRFAADQRLLRIEITPPPAPEPETPKSKGRAKKPAAPRTVECRLPGELRPSGFPEDRAVLLEPGARWEEAFDPALFCFGAADAKALAPGARVVVKLGFPAAASTRKVHGKVVELPERAPFVAEPTALEPKVAGLKEVVAAPFTLADPPSSDDPKTKDPSADPLDPGAPRLEVTTPARLDASSARSLAIATTVRNAGTRSMTALLRSDLLWFDVQGPTGVFRCGPSDADRTSPRDSFTTLRAGGRQSFDVLLGEICPRDTFKRPGLYTVRAGIRVTDDGATYRLSAFTGEATAAKPTLVRVRSGDRPFYVARPDVKRPEHDEP